MPLLVFSFYNGGSDYSYLDNVSVVDNNAPSIQLLNNPGFEDSTSNITGWTSWCSTTANCGAGNTGQILANSTCYSGNCYMDHCHTNYDFLAQSFLATMVILTQFHFGCNKWGRLLSNSTPTSRAEEFYLNDNDERDESKTFDY
jgi:hypothetical protein